MVLVERRRDLHDVEVLDLNAAPREVGYLVELGRFEAARVARGRAGRFRAAHSVDVERDRYRAPVLARRVERLKEKFHDALRDLAQRDDAAALLEHPVVIVGRVVLLLYAELDEGLAGERAARQLRQRAVERRAAVDSVLVAAHVEVRVDVDEPHAAAPDIRARHEAADAGVGQVVSAAEDDGQAAARDDLRDRLSLRVVDLGER